MGCDRICVSNDPNSDKCVAVRAVCDALDSFCAGVKRTHSCDSSIVRFRAGDAGTVVSVTTGLAGDTCRNGCGRCCGCWNAIVTYGVTTVVPALDARLRTIALAAHGRWDGWHAPLVTRRSTDDYCLVIVGSGDNGRRASMNKGGCRAVLIDQLR